MQIADIKNLHDEIIRSNLQRGLSIWRNSTGKIIYYQTGPFQTKKKIENIDELSNLFHMSVKIYNTIDDIDIIYDGFILVLSLLPRVETEVFNPYSYSNFFIYKNTIYKNTFIYTDYLIKRLDDRDFNNPFRLDMQYTGNIAVVDQLNNLQLSSSFTVNNNIEGINQSLDSLNKSFIEEFIRKITKNKEQFDYIMTWLSSYFQTLNRSHALLVLIGDNNTSDIFVNNIIKPIFAKKHEYLFKFNDELMQKKGDLDIKNKIFYHIDNLSEKYSNNKKLKKILLNLLIKKKSFSFNNMNNIFYYGQLLVTANKNNPFGFLQPCYSQCTIFSIKDLDNILKELGIDEITLYNKIENDLDRFSNILANYECKSNFDSTPINTMEKESLPFMKKGVLLTPTLDKKINNFILAIENKNISYFSNIKKENEELYQELIENFEEDMIAQPLLSTYFNLIENENIFSDNSYFIDILKKKNIMFSILPLDSSKRNNKKRYTIPKTITIEL